MQHVPVGVGSGDPGDVGRGVGNGDSGGVAEGHGVTGVRVGVGHPGVTLPVGVAVIDGVRVRVTLPVRVGVIDRVGVGVWVRVKG